MITLEKIKYDKDANLVNVHFSYDGEDIDITNGVMKLTVAEFLTSHYHSEEYMIKQALQQELRSLLDSEWETEEVEE